MWVFLIDASATSVGTKVVFVIDKMLLKRRPAHEGPAEEVYERDRTMQLEQQVEVLTQ